MAGQRVATMRLTRNRLSEVARALPGAVSTELRRGTEATERGARARSPVATGELRDSHDTEGTTPGSLSMRVTVTAPHGPFVHEGTIRMPPRPWLRETAEQTIPATVEGLKRLGRSL